MCKTHSSQTALLLKINATLYRTKAVLKQVKRGDGEKVLKEKNSHRDRKIFFFFFGGGGVGGGYIYIYIYIYRERERE